MLDSLRKAAGTWIAKFLFVILVISFVGWGVSGQMTGGVASGDVLSAGKTSVSATEYRLAYDRALSQMSRQFGTRLTREQAKAIGLDQQVLGSLVGSAVLSEQARKLGLGLSKDRIAALTADDPAFKGLSGKFDRQQFDYVLRQVGMRPQDYFDTRAAEAVRQQIVEATLDGMSAPDAFLRAVALYRGEDRTVDYLVLQKALVEPIGEPSAEVLAKWFEENKADYGAPEYRKIHYVKLEPEDISDPTAVTDKQISDEYEANKAKFTTPATRNIEQLVFPSVDEARKASDAIKAGTKSFDGAVADQKKQTDDVQLGILTKDKIADKAVADAAFALGENQVSDVIQGAFGPVLLRATKITPEAVKQLSDVKEQIRNDLALAEANRILLDVHDAYEDARAGGSSLQQAADQLKLTVMTVDAVDRQGMRPDGTVVNDLPASQALLESAFQADVKAENQPVNSGSAGYVFYEVDSIEAARDRKLDEVKDKVIADWKADQAATRLQAKADEIAKRIKDGTLLDTIATELTLEKQTKRGLKREADDPDFGKPGVVTIFGVAKDQTGSFEAPNGTSRIVFKVTESVEPVAADASSIPEDARNNFAGGFANDILDQLVSRLRGEFDVEVNQAAIDQALAF